MEYRWLARGAFVVAAGFGIVSCGGGGMGDTGMGGATAGAGRGGTGTVGTGGTATGGSTGAGGGGVTACGTVEPCGGGPVEGTWSFIADCVDLGEYNLIMQRDLACPQARVTKVDLRHRYSEFTFSSERTYSLGENITASIDFNMPNSCINGHTCNDWATIESLTAGASFTCGGTSTCVCNETFSDSSSDTGTYSVSGTNINLTSTVTGATSAIGYCIQGESTIHFITVDPNMHTGPGGQATIFKDTVAQRL